MSMFGTEFLSHQGPPGAALAKYDRTKYHDDQPSSTSSGPSVPPIFLDAMSIREKVFVEEQKVPIENEYDADDARSHHWVSYASVGKRGSVGGNLEPVSSNERISKEELRRRSQPTSSKMPVGTVRIVPPPHAPHPAPDSHHKIDNAEGFTDKPHESTAPSSTLDTHKTHEVPDVGLIHPEEPFIKLGRLAIIQEYRRFGMGKMLLEEALRWAGEHPDEVVPRATSAADRERAKDHYRQNSDPAISPHAVPQSVSGSEDVDEWSLGKTEPIVDQGPWKGLVLVHAQKHLEKTYGKWGFVRDEALGIWDEEGIDHIGMWRRVKVTESRM